MAVDIITIDNGEIPYKYGSGRFSGAAGNGSYWSMYAPRLNIQKSKMVM
jgi:hypothetical protein